MVVHGKTSAVQHDGRGLFEGLPSPFAATRYHSLAIDSASLPPELAITARSVDDGVVMAIAHADHRTFGVQFHPESVLTRWGARLLRSFLNVAGMLS